MPSFFVTQGSPLGVKKPGITQPPPYLSKKPGAAQPPSGWLVAVSKPSLSSGSCNGILMSGSRFLRYQGGTYSFILLPLGAQQGIITGNQ